MLPLVVLGAAAWYLSRPQRNPDWITVEGKHIPLRHGDGRAGDPTPYDPAKVGEKGTANATRRSSAVTARLLTQDDIPAISGAVTIAHTTELLQNARRFAQDVAAQGRELSMSKEDERRTQFALQRSAQFRIQYLEQLLDRLQAVDVAAKPTASKSALRTVVSNWIQWVKLDNSEAHRATWTLPQWDQNVRTVLGAASRDAKARLEQLPKGQAPMPRRVDERWRSDMVYRGLEDKYDRDLQAFESGRLWADFAARHKIPRDKWDDVRPYYDAHRRAQLDMDHVALESKTRDEYDSIYRRGSKSALHEKHARASLLWRTSENPLRQKLRELGIPYVGILTG